VPILGQPQPAQTFKTRKTGWASAIFS
jgi:hypothetical protein